MKTSVKISILFTIMTIVIMVVFASLLQIIYFQRRYTSVKQKIFLPQHAGGVGKRFLPKEIAPRKILLTNPLQQKELEKKRVFLDIYYRENTRLLVHKQKQNRILMVIDNQIEGQKKLAQISIFLIGLFAGISYVTSRFFVYVSLKNLRKLLQFIQGLDMQKLDKKFFIEGPVNDEINIVGEALNAALAKINNQTKTLKDFITHASHELKTPLMALASSVEYMDKAKSYEKTLPDVKATIKNMQQLIEKLLTLARLETTVWAHKEIDISLLIKKTLETTEIVYEKKQIHIQTSLPKSLKICVDPTAFTIIIGNLIDNAMKYANKKGIVEIKLKEYNSKTQRNTSVLIKKDLTQKNEQEYELEITNTGKGISKANFPFIRNQFWKENTGEYDTKSFGLGLAIVRKVVENLGRTINVTSDENKTTFTLLFHSLPKSTLST